MKRGGILRDLLVVFTLVLVGYIGFYQLDRHLRLRKGPWEVAFTTVERAPAIVVRQPALNISEVTIRFAGEELPESFKDERVTFDRPARTVPFGKLIFDDLMIQPGTVTLHLFGHEVELLPRTLIINRHEVPWRSGETVILTAADKLPAGALEPRKKKR